MLACASSHGVGGVSRRRGHIFQFAGHVRLEPLTALIVRRAVGCALGRTSEIVHE